MSLRIVLTAFALAALTAASAFAQTVRVPADHASLVRLPADAAGIVVGNPDIADATLYDARTLFVTGKVHGRTNLIALDEAGRVIFTADLAVTASERGSVDVFKNTARLTYTCDPVCQLVPAAGGGQASAALAGGPGQN
ncbi:MAG: pilus assembly protein N-terminal domain-containing protein [Oceanicaulis sp.]